MPVKNVEDCEPLTGPWTLDCDPQTSAVLPAARTWRPDPDQRTRYQYSTVHVRLISL